MGKYREHATTNSLAVTTEVFEKLREAQRELQKTSQQMITIDDTLRHFFNLKGNKWGRTRFER